MKGSQTSTTAQGIAALRAIESEKPAGERICYDPYARRLTSPFFLWLSKTFLGYAERRGPGVPGFIVCRCRYFEDHLAACLQRGIRQVVILGAGLDSHAYRPELQGLGVRFFEVDQPATQAGKIAAVRRLFGSVPEGVTYVPIDFNTETLDKLLACGYNPAQPALFWWEGVTYYLVPQAVDATLAWIQAHAAPQSSLIFDYMYDTALKAEKKRGEIERMQRYSRFTGEGLVFGIQRGKIEEFLLGRGFHQVVDADAARLQQLYCVGPNAGRTVAEVYAIVHALI